MSTPLFIDFETRSEADIKTAGAEKYAEHPSTRVLIMCWAFGDGPVETWRDDMGEPFPIELFDPIRAGCEVVAHNAHFEMCMWQGPLKRQVRKLPPLRPEQVTCTMARSRALSLPGALDDVAEVLRLSHQKDRRGSYLINKLSKPQRNRDGTTYWNNDPALMAEFAAYCAKDVQVEREIYNRLMPLSEPERRLWCHDWMVNQRGIAIDLESVRWALALADAEQNKAAVEVAELTGGVACGATEVQKLVGWLNAKGIATDGLTKAQVAALIRDNPDAAPEVKRVLELRKEASKASVAKLKAMQKRACADGRARGLLSFHGAGTGRWAGRAVQPQNMPRSPEDFDEPSIATALRLLRHPKASTALRLTFGNPLDVVSWLLRSLIIAAPGHELHAADFSNIEGRVLAWLANEDWKLAAFRDYDAGTGPDLYKLAYSRSFSVPVDAVSKDQRQIGKVQELALGYGGGKGAFASMAANYGIWVGEDISLAPKDAKQALSFDQAEDIKRAWRDAHPATTALWWGLDKAARAAIKKPGTPAYAADGRIVYKMHGMFLLCRLPNGRVLAYPNARLEKNADTGRDDITYDGLNSYTRQWGPERTYSGKLAENCVQAIARDVLVDAMFAVEAAGFPVVLHVHDEIVCECPKGSKTLEELSRLMSAVRPWAAGLPVAVSGFTSERYRK